MDLDEVKKYIRVDYEDDDDYITLLIDVAKDYVSDGFAHYDEKKATHRLLALKAIKTLYDERADVGDLVTKSIKVQQMLN